MPPPGRNQPQIVKKSAIKATKKDAKSEPARSTPPKVAAEPVPAQLPVVSVEPTQRQPSAAALKVFEQAVKVFNKRQFDAAKVLFENLPAKYPQEFEILARVNTYLRVCNQRLAKSVAAPQNADELYDRGVFALNTGDYAVARGNFEQALQIRPDEAYIIYSLAATLLQLGEIDQALNHLQRAIQLQPRLRSQVVNDPDFTELRENRQFLALMGITSPFDRLDPRR